jgi:hypothetical protein
VDITEVGIDFTESLGAIDRLDLIDNFHKLLLGFFHFPHFYKSQRSIIPKN